MRRREWVFAGAILLALAAVGGTGVWFLPQDRPASAATSPDGSWSVAVVGKRRFNGAYELVVEVRDRGGRLAPAGAFVAGLSRDPGAAERNYPVRFLDSESAQVGDRSLKKAEFFRR